MKPSFDRSRAVVCGILLLSLGGAASAATFNVSTLTELRNALDNARSGDEIVVAAGTYTTSIELYMNYPGVTLRGATGNFADVVIKGGGFNSTSYARIVLHIKAAYCTVKDLTLGDCYWHALFFENGADYATVRNIRIYNAGEQVVKGVRYSTGCLFEKSLLEYTDVRINDNISRPNDYLGGIDLHGARNWIIRDNIVRNIIGQGGEGDSGIFLWNNSSNCIVERNVVYGCNKGISYGNPGSSGTWAMNGGIVRNNFIYAKTNSQADVGMEMCFVKDVKVYNNTIWTDSGSFFRTIQFNDSLSIPNTNLVVAYNIVRGNFWDFTSGRYTSIGNITGNVAQANWFVDPANANFHLTELAVPAIGQAASLLEVADDFDGQVRPIDDLPDVGADEYVPADLDGDGHVDSSDLLIFAGAWAKSAGEPGYNAKADLDDNNRVGVLDLLFLAKYWGL